MKRVVILQPNYIPWKGYFDLIAAADECILYDDAQYTKRDWRNRNQIKTPNGVRWLTVPVHTRNASRQRIADVRIVPGKWAQDHWESLARSYRRAQHFDAIAREIAPLYLERSYVHLSELNRTLIQAICGLLGIRTALTSSTSYRLEGGATERLVGLCRQARATEYITGPAARGYLEEDLFQRNDLRVHWFDYSGYPEYAQLWGPFTHQVSVLDLLFNCGSDAPKYMRWVRA